MDFAPPCALHFAPCHTALLFKAIVAFCGLGVRPLAHAGAASQTADVRFGMSLHILLPYLPHLEPYLTSLKPSITKPKP